MPSRGSCLATNDAINGCVASNAMHSYFMASCVVLPFLRHRELQVGEVSRGVDIFSKSLALTNAVQTGKVMGPTRAGNNPARVETFYL
jgi:hypothetical protein